MASAMKCLTSVDADVRALEPDVGIKLRFSSHSVHGILLDWRCSLAASILIATAVSTALMAFVAGIVRMISF